MNESNYYSVPKHRSLGQINLQLEWNHQETSICSLRLKRASSISPKCDNFSYLVVDSQVEHSHQDEQSYGSIDFDLDPQSN